MIKRSNHWRTNLIALIGFILLLCAIAAVVFGFATFEQATGFISLTIIPLLLFGLNKSADAKAVDNNTYKPL
jgi:hypothetical protein